MRFGKTLQQSVYSPWKGNYIDYVKLKGMLREHETDEDSPWTEEDEKNFSNEIFSEQLEKVAKFQEDTFNSLQKRVDGAFERLKSLAPTDTNSRPKSDITTEQLKDIESELDILTNEVKELRRFSTLNYTGFLKIVKKHDRKRGDRYKIRPMMQLSLASRPFNSDEGYSPLLNKLSVMYFVIRQHLEETTGIATEQPPIPDMMADQELGADGERFTSHKFWVHPENLLEVKTLILRQLPALVFSQLATSKDLEISEDPTITSLYFDNKHFHLYSNKVNSEMRATSLRLRWYGQLSENPIIMLEKKTVDRYGSSEEERFPIKSKYVKAFIEGNYKMEKAIAKMERQSQPAEDIEHFKKVVASIANFIMENHLEPVMRANYVRSAFQKPQDDRVRISLDTDIAFIREDTVDRDRPCRNPNDWHRTDIDNSNMMYPFKNINQSELSLLPFALLEIKVKGWSGENDRTWVSDLMGSHLLYGVPRFSKFVHGVASLCEDAVNTLPFWLSDLEKDIRKDPQAAFEEENLRRARLAESEEVVGSFLGTKGSSFKQTARNSPMARSHMSDRQAAEISKSPAKKFPTASPHPASSDLPTSTSASISHLGSPPVETSTNGSKGYGSTLVFGGLGLSRYRRARQAKSSQQLLPEGVSKPETWIKNEGPLKVEPKVWLANERTYLKWQHICVLLSSMAVALYTAAASSDSSENPEQETIAMVLGILYLVIAVLAGLWGWYMHRLRRSMIYERSGRDFDNMIGPMGVALALAIALVLNFYFQYRAAFAVLRDGQDAGIIIVNSSDVGNVLGDELRV